MLILVVRSSVPAGITRGGGVAGDDVYKDVWNWERPEGGETEKDRIANQQGN